MRSKAVSVLCILTLSLISGVAVADPVNGSHPDDVQTGRSVAVTTLPAHDYWLSRDLNRLFLQSPAPDGARSETPNH